MSRLYLVRHGQADRLGKDYDRLTSLGQQQAKDLGQYFKEHRIEFDALITGTLKRQKETTQTILESFRSEKYCIPDPRENSAWDEFDGKLWMGLAAKIRKSNPQFEALYESYKTAWEAGKPETRTYFQKMIQIVLSAWVDGSFDPIEPYTFSQYVEKVLMGLRDIPSDANSILVVSSSTPIAIVMGSCSRMDQKDFKILMKSILNTSLSVFEKEDKEWLPVSWNGTPHLRSPDLVTLL